MMVTFTLMILIHLTILEHSLLSKILTRLSSVTTSLSTGTKPLLSGWMTINKDMQYYIMLRGISESFRPLNFPGPPAHIVISRKRRRAIQRAAFMDHTGYEWSQWWHKRREDNDGE